MLVFGCVSVPDVEQPRSAYQQRQAGWVSAKADSDGGQVVKLTKQSVLQRLLCCCQKARVGLQQPVGC